MKSVAPDIYECPSFVDTHSHDDLALLGDPERADKRNQGIGVQVIGNCGICPFPNLPRGCAPVRRLFDAVMGPSTRRFPSIRAYRRLVPRKDIVVLQGYNALRAALFGPRPKKLNAVERKRAASAVARSVEAGAAGLSLGLAYLPVVGADSEELNEISRETPLLTVHLRNESSTVLESIDEVLEIAGRARCRLHISHLKISGRPFWPLAERLIRRIRQAHERFGVTFDHYPYAYGCTALSAVLPPEISSLPGSALARLHPRTFERRFRDRDWENYVLMCGWAGIQLASLEKYPEYNGRRVAEVTRRPLDLIVKLVREEPHPAMLIYSQDDRLIDELLKLPFGCVGTDGLPPVREHPRLTSTFPEYLKRCRSIGMPAKDAVEKAAILPRRIFRVPPGTGGTVLFNWRTGEIVRRAAGPNIAEGRSTSRSRAR
ncbi:MAG: hypothetical protein A3G34_14535 [Candidatus Lindowbacteria bacterium RIFCSPLOWO2_12_FULL_62_27]|nr:MAG: hypothetical protein A3G34_14535 [Candidatus Lindowbacteria bacterium RIFCSPLOWO2_12_FULL_62_27]